MTSFKYFFFSLFLLSACGEDKSKIKLNQNPEQIAVSFFDALYNDKDVEKAARVCSPQLARVILHYRSSQAVARHLFNMSYDNVEVTPDDSGVKVREQFSGKAAITLYFNGIYNEQRVKDVKRLLLIQQNGTWVIDKILKDPF
jgi:hypothetical protein